MELRLLRRVRMSEQTERLETCEPLSGFNIIRELLILSERLDMIEESLNTYFDGLISVVEAYGVKIAKPN